MYRLKQNEAPSYLSR